MVSRMCSKGGETPVNGHLRCGGVSLPPTHILAYLTTPPLCTQNKGLFKYTGHAAKLKIEAVPVPVRP